MGSDCTRLSHRIAACACIWLAGMAGCAPDSSVAPLQVASQAQELVGGMNDSADPAVVTLEMIVGSSGSGCTASFIDRNVLLTAAHCVSDDYGRMPSGSKYRFFRGADLKTAGAQDWTSVQAKNVHAHPKYNPNTSANDVAVLILDQPLDVTPIPLNTKPLTQDMVGTMVRLVGYGSTTGVSTANDGFGVKRTLTTTIQMVQSDVVLIGTTGHQACDGDSGGPALLQVGGVETIVGTDDYNSDGLNCTRGDYYQRVDRQLDFIMPFLSTPGMTAPDAGVSTQVPSGPLVPAGGMGGTTVVPVVPINPVADAGMPVVPDAGVSRPIGAAGAAPSAAAGGIAPPRAGAGAAGYAAPMSAVPSVGGSTGSVAPHVEKYSSGCSVAPSGGFPFAQSSTWIVALAFLHRKRRSMALTHRGG